MVLLRSSLGFNGAKIFGLLRCITGIFMFGVQTYFLSKAIVYLIRIGIFSFNPEILNKDPYKEGWIVKIKIKDKAELDSLISADDYEKFVEGK